MTNGRQRSADLIDAVVENMRQNLEKLKFATLAPSRYTVYLSPAEHARLEGIIPRLQAEAIRALDEELARLNRPAWLRRRLRGCRAGGRRRSKTPAHDGTSSSCATRTASSRHEGDIIVHSDLVLAPDLELGVGERTRRITTVRDRRTHDVARAGRRPSAGPRQPFTRVSPIRTTTARISTTSSGTRRRSGAAALAYPVDVRLATSEDVSREHARIRVTHATGSSS